MKTRPFVITLILGSLSLCEVVYGQFIPYSQYDRVPLQTSPAAVSVTPYGQVSVQYRRSRIAGYDLPSVSFIYPFFRRSDSLQHGGLGVNVVSQYAGLGKMYVVTGATGTFGYAIHLSKKHRIGAGISGGVVNKRIDASRITTDSQYNLGMYDPSLGHGEDLRSTSVIKPVIHAGLCWIVTDLVERQMAVLSVAAYDINKPVFDLLTNSVADDITYIASGEFTLFRHGRMAVRPTCRLIWQGNGMASIGSHLTYGSDLGRNVIVSGWYKTTGALAASLQYSSKTFFISASTDLAIASNQDVNVSNAMEIGLGCRIKHSPKWKLKNTPAPAKESSAYLQPMSPLHLQTSFHSIPTITRIAK